MPGGARIARFAALAAIVCLLTTGCSLTRIGYDMAPTLALWRIARYVTLDADQEALVRRHLDSIHAWHRTTQLTRYARLIADVGDGVHARIEPTTIGRWRARAREFWPPLADRMAPALAELAPRLSAAQIEEIRRALEAEDREMRERHGGAADAVRRHRFERFSERIGGLVGDLTPAQHRTLRDRMADLDTGEADWMAERIARQQRVLSYLDRVRRGELSGEAATTAARRLLAGLFEVADPDRRRASEAVDARTNGVYAELLASATEDQRRTLQDRLRGWRADAEHLATN
ncbi:MAG: hypothetical protein H6934_02070 [Burkholderiaceae bacterium]|nr:hypothetical protein [Burkholderiaceae bacterium]